MRVAVEDGEEDGERLLHTEKPFERPFPMELLGGLAARDARGGYRVLTSIIALRGAGPEEKAEVERERGGGGQAVLRATGLEVVGQRGVRKMMYVRTWVD